MTTCVRTSVAADVATRFARWYLRHIYGPPFDYHIANSDYTADELRQVMWDRAPDFIRVRPMGVDATRHGPSIATSSSAAACSNERAGGPTACSCCMSDVCRPRRTSVCSSTRWIAWCARSGRGQVPAHDYRLVIVGDGPSRAALERDAARMTPGRTLMLGATEGEMLRRYYASADVFLHPNAREPFGIAPLEAMASGVSVVVPNAGGVLSYANRDNAALAVRRTRGLCARGAFGGRDPRRSRIADARRTAEAHDWPQIASRWFDDLCAHHSRGVTERRLAS